MTVFNDNRPNKKSKIQLHYGSKKGAINTIKKLKKQTTLYQHQGATSMYYRAKYHKHQTNGMRNAMKIYKKFLKTLKAKHNK